MKKLIIMAVAFVALVAIYLIINSSQDASVQTPINNTNAQPENTSSEQKLGELGGYVEYSSDNFEAAVASRRVLFFYANWCPTCRPADADFINNLDKIPEDVTIIRVSYNDSETNQEEKDLASKYGVVYQHTFVQIDENGDEVAKWNGGQMSQLLQNIK